jgi:hypothetical protein
LRLRHSAVHAAMSMGCVSGVASGSSFHILMVLSASHLSDHSCNTDNTRRVIRE